MRQTEEKQFNQERKKPNKKGLVILLVALIAVIALAVILCASPIKEKIFKCENHIDANLDLICDECKDKIPCIDGEIHADVNNDLLCDNCGAGIASSDVSVYKEIESGDFGEKTVNVRGNMPTDTKVAMEEISHDEAISLAQKFVEIESKDVIEAYDITLSDNENIKYQPADDGEKVKVTISNLNIDPSRGLAMMHIIDENNYEVIALDSVTSTSIEFTTERFSTYILVDFGTSNIVFTGLGTYTVLNSDNVPLVNGVTVANNTNFEFKILPLDNYVLGDIIIAGAGDATISKTAYGAGYAYVISEVSSNITVSVTNTISLTNPITLNALTDGEWTNQDVVVEIDWPVTNFTNQIKIDDGEWIEYNDPTYTMTASGTLYARVYDGDQGGGEVSVAVNNIDKDAPEITLYLSTDGYARAVDVYMDVTEKGSGIYGYASSIWSYSYCTSFTTCAANTFSLSNIYIGSDSSNRCYYALVKDMAGNEGKAYIDINNVDRGTPIISDGTSYSYALYNQYKGYGSALSSYSDAMFKNSYGGIGGYAQPSKFSMTRMTYTEAGQTKWSGTSSDYLIKMTSVGKNSWDALGGWNQSFTPQPGGLYLHRFVAKIPVGYTIGETANSWSGTGGWITSNAGTGDWYEYIYVYDLAETGTFMSVSYNYLTGNPGTTEEPLEWYLAYNTVYDLTHLWDDTGVTYNTDASATLNIRASDGFSGIKSITVNEAEIDFTEVTAGSDKVVTADYKITAPGAYVIKVTDNAGNSTSMTRTAYLISYDGNGADGGTTANQIKIGRAWNAHEAANESVNSINKSIALRQNGYTNSNGLSFQGWGTNTDEIVEYMAGSRYYGTGDITLYAVWNDGIVWDVSKTTSDNVRAKVSEITAGSDQYQLTIYGTGQMKSWSGTEANAGALPWNSYRDKIYKVVVEEGVTNIGSMTMFSMKNLTSFDNVIFPSTLTRLESNFARQSSNLRGTLNISKNIVYVGAMYNVPVEEIVVDSENPYYSSLDGVLYNKNQTTLIMYPVGSSKTSFVIPSTVTTVGGEAMEHSNVTDITIPTSVTSLSGWCFGTNPFKNVYLHKGITKFQNGVFYGLYGVDSVYIHAEDITIESNAFTNAKAGSKIYTVSKAVADKFKAGTHYTSANTTIYYPPYFSSHPTSRSAGEGTTTTFNVTAQNGVAAGTLTYQWQYRENSSADWKNVTSDQGTGGNSSSFTTVALTSEMNGYQFRCKLANGIYPNAQITEDEIANSVISAAGTLTVIQANYYFNGKYYETLADVYPDVKLYYSNTVEGVYEATITVNKDCVDASDFTHAYGSNKNKLTIDTNGHTLTKTTYPIKNNGPLYITGSGTITSSSDSTQANIDTVIQNNGTLNINGATVRHRGMVSSNYMAIHNATASSTVTVNSGTVAEEYGLEVSGTGTGRAIYSNVASTITVNGGTVTSRTNRTGCSAIEAYGTAKTSIYVYGGTVSSLYTTAVYITSGSASATTESLIQAEGGTINGKVYGINYDTGCTSVLRVNGATVTGGTSGVINNSSNSETLLMSGTIDGDTVAITNAANGPVSIKGGTVKGKTGILNASTSSSRVTIYTGTIDSTEYGIHNAGAGEIRIENGEIKANVASVYNSGTGTIKVLGGTIVSGVRGILDDGNGTITLGEEDGAISVTSPVVQGEAYGVYGANTSVINFYDGKVKGKGLNPFYKESADEPINDMETGYSLFRTKEGEYTAATLQSGWDISKDPTTGTTAWAVIEQDANDMNKYKLIITATPNTSGAMKDFTTTDTPWNGYKHLIATVDIQDGISNIGANMLYGAESLVNLTIPDSITAIGEFAFRNCSSISGTFTIPSSVTAIGINPFANATFENFAVASGNTAYVVENNILMNATKTEVIAYPAGSTTESVVIPNTVTSIDVYAFHKAKFANITIPSSVKTIGSHAFSANETITTLTIPSSVTMIDAFAFSDMTNLKTVYLHTSVSASYVARCFVNMASGSIIYTTSYDVYTKLSDQYTTANTQVYYPPKITVQPYDQELVCPDPGTFSVTVQNGNPTGITYQWYIKEPGAADWRVVTSSDGTGGTTATFTTGSTVPDMIGTEYRCIVSSAQYPNDYFTRSEIETDTVSRAASLSISGGNFQVDGGLYYPTLQAALEAAGSGTHTISVVTDITDDSTPVVAADQVITLDMKNKTVTKTTGLISGMGETFGGIQNNGTLTIKNGGAIETINNANAGYQWLICNKGTLNLQGSTIRHNGNANMIAYAMLNYGTFNMTSGAVEMKLNSTIASTAQYSARGITNFEGTLNISGGTVLIDYPVPEANLSVEKEMLAYAVEGWDADYEGDGSEKTGAINISGTANITSTGKAIVIKYDSEGYTSNHALKISGGTITADEYGIWASQYAEGSIEITGGTITSDETAITIESTNAIPVSVSNATITSNNGMGIQSKVDGSEVTIGTDAVITTGGAGIVIYGSGTYTQTAGRITAGSSALHIEGDATVNITGGTIVSNSYTALDFYGSTGTVNVNLSNVSITGKNVVVYASAYHTNLNIYSGTYKTTETNDSAIYYSTYYTGTCVIGETGKTGPTINAAGTGVYAEGNTIINSGNISGKTGVYMFCGQLSTAKLTVNAGTISGTEYAIQAVDNEEIEINGGTISSNNCIVSLAGASKATINNGTFSSQNTGIIMSDSATLTMKDGTIDTLINGIVNNGTGKLIVESGKIYAGQYGIEHKGEASNLDVGVDDETEWVSKVLPEIRATVAVKSTNGFNFYDGILKGITAPNEGDVVDWPDKYGLYTGTETIDSKTYNTLYIAMGWNISADTSVDNVWAFLEKTTTGRTLTIEGTGAIKDYAYADEDYSNIPWYEYYDEIDKLIIEEGITRIGNRVFGKLSGVTTITIPEGVVELGDYAFCRALYTERTITLPSTLTTIEINPFYASKVVSISVDSDNSFYKVIDNVLFTSDGTKLVSYSTGKPDTTYVVPETVTHLLDHSMSQANILEKLVIGSNVTTIERQAAYSSSTLKEIYIDSTKVTTVDSRAFSDSPAGSIIYTKSKSIADLFVADTNYTSANTQIYYPPVINTQPVSQTITEGNSVTFSVAVTAGNPSATTYTWQYKSATGSWTNATATQGTGYDQNTFTIAKVTSDLDGYQYRCLVSTDGYPNEEMTSEELGLTSNVAVLSVNAPNYQVGSLYYNTLKEAVASITTTAETRIEVLLNNTEEDFVLVGSTQNIILDLNDKVINIAGISTVNQKKFIQNEGTLTLTGSGAINMVNNDVAGWYALIHNKATLNVLSGTYSIENLYSSENVYLATIANMLDDTVTNISGGNLIAKNSYLGDSSAVHGDFGTVNMSEGKIEATHYAITNNGNGAKQVLINVTGGEIYAKIGIYVLAPAAGGQANTKVTVSGNPSIISNGSCGIFNAYSTEPVVVTGGTIQGVRFGIDSLTSDIIVGTQGGEVSTSVPTVIGGEAAVYSNKTTYFYDGILKTNDKIHSGDIVPETGYGLQYGSDGTYTTAILSTTNYTDGTSYYSSLQNAFEKAPSGATIKPTKDLTDNEVATLAEGKTMTLDLDGKTISVNALSDSSVESFITNNGTLTLKGQGNISMITSNNAKAIIYNNKTLDVLEGTYSLENKVSERVISAIATMTSAATTNVSGGEIIATSDYNTWTCALNAYAGTTNVSGGKITATGTSGKAYAIGSSGASTSAKIINVTGGEINGATSGIALVQLQTSYTGTNATLKVSENAKIAGGNYGIYNTFSVKDITIAGGTIEGGTDAVYNTASKTIIGTSGGGVSTTYPVITGGNYGVNSTNGIAFYDGILKGKTATHSGEIETDRYYGVQYGTEGEYKTAMVVSANYYDGTSYYATLTDAFNMAESGSTVTLVQYLSEGAQIDDAVLESDKTITLDLAGKNLSRASKIINNGKLTITNSSENPANLYMKDEFIQQSGTLKIENITVRLNITSVEAAIKVTGGTVTLKSGNIYSVKKGIKVEGGTLILGINGGDVSTTVPMIQADEEAISSDKFTWYDGILKSKVEGIYTGTTTEAIHYSPDFGTEIIDGVTYNTTWLARDQNYEMNGEYFATVADAIAAYPEGGTINQIRNLKENSAWSFTVPEGKTYCLKLNGFETLGGPNTSVIIDGNLEIEGPGNIISKGHQGAGPIFNVRKTGKLALKSGVEVKYEVYNGVILHRWLIYNLGTVTIKDDVILDASETPFGTAIYNVDDGAVTNIEGGKIAKVNLEKGTLNMQGGEIVGEPYAWGTSNWKGNSEGVAIGENATLNFSGGYIKSNGSVAISGDGTIVTPENYEVYYYTEGTYDCARVELGWDISVAQDGSIIAYLVPNGDNYTLEVIGSGATKSYTEDTKETAPWHSYYQKITNLTMTEGITVLGAYIFSDLLYLSEVTLPNTLIELEECALVNCGFETITIPASVTTMEANPFARTPIKTMIVEDGNTDFKVENNMLMTMDGKRVVAYAFGNFEDTITIPTGVTTLSAFSFAGALAIVNIPTTVIEIKKCAFDRYGASMLVIPASVQKLESGFARKTNNLVSVYFLGTNFTLEGEKHFSGSSKFLEIYTRSAAVASKFIDGTHYNSSSGATVYYPPVVGGTLLDTTVNSMKTVTFEVTVTPGVPDSVKYNWQVKRVGTDTWVGLIDGQGLGTSKYTTTQLTVNNSGDEYRCIINGMNGTTEVYPNTYMPITDSDMTEKLISDTAKVYVRAANYLVNEEYFETLEDAVAAVPAGTATTIKLLTDLEDNSPVTIPANKNVTLDIQAFTLNRQDEVITNNGTLNIIGTGTLKVESATLVDNKGTLKITQAATNVVSTSTSAVAIINSGSVELNKLSLTTAYTAIQSTAGTVKVSGGTITADGGSSTTAISGIVTSGGTVEILGGSIISTNDSKTVIGVTVQSGATLNMSAGTVSSNAAGIQNNGGTVVVTGGTISADNKGIENLGTSGNVTIGSDDGSVYRDGITITGEEYGYYSNTSATLSFFDGTIKGKQYAIQTKTAIITPDEYDVNYAAPFNDPYVTATLVRANYYWNGSWFGTLNDGIEEISSREFDFACAIDIYAGDNFTSITDTEAVTVTNLSDYGINLILRNGVAIDFEKTITVNSGVTFNVINDGTLGTINATVVNNGTLDFKANLTGTLTNNGTATLGATSGTLVNTVSGSVTNTGTMTINQTTVTGAVTSSGSALTLNGGTLNGGVTMSSGCKFTMTSGAVNKSNGVAVTNSGTGAIEILSGSITGTTYGINNTGTGAITIGSLTNGVISSGDPIITGGTYGVKTSADFNFYDGMLRGKTGSYSGTVTAVEEGTHIKKDTPEGNGTDYHRAYIEHNDVFVEVWDISKTAGTDEVYAGIKVVAGDGVNADTRYKLVVWGTGATKDFEYSWSTSAGKYESTTPWFDVYGSRIIELVLEEGVTRYGNSIFAALINVTSDIVLPQTLTSLGSRAFESDYKITGNVEIPKNLVEIGTANPFGATRIESFSIAQGNTIFEVKNEGLYRESKLLAYPNGSATTKPIVTEGTTEIGMCAFYKNKNVETIILPNSLKIIRDSAIDSTSITEITIPNSVTKISSYAFAWSDSLKNVFLKSETLTLEGTAQFMRMASNSIIYTESKEIADLFIADTTYTAANTSVYYPFKVLEMPEDFALTIRDSIEIEPNIREGFIASDVVYQWYLNGNPIAGANSATYTKATVEDSDSGDYQVLIKSALQEDGTYYYSHMSEKTHLRVRDHVGPESVSISVSYLDDANGVGYAQVTVTASDTYSGVDKFYVNDVELTSGVTITNDGTGLTGGSGVAVFDIKTDGEYTISVADAEDNRTNRTLDAYSIEYLPGSDYQVTGDTKSQIVIKGYSLLVRSCGFVKTGHTFTGWSDNNENYYNAQGLGDLYYDFFGNTIMTAQWQINTYTVQFYNDAGDGKGSVLVESKQYNYEDIIKVPETQYHLAEMVGTDQYKIYRHKNNWKATTLDNQSVFKAENISDANINAIWMVDSNVRYDATYTVTTYDIGNATVYLDGDMYVSGDVAIQNDEGVVYIGPSPLVIYGPVYNNNGLIFNNQ